MAKRQVTLTFPQDLIKEPVIFTVAKQFNLIPNIRRAKITETIGEVTLEIEGSDKDLEAGLKAFTAKGVKVEPVTGDVISG